jgi:hypothetical protein
MFTFYKMAEKKSLPLPVILDGTFFKIVKEVDNKVTAKCINCVNNEISGARNATSNFLRHLRVSSLSSEYSSDLLL